MIFSIFFTADYSNFSRSKDMFLLTARHDALFVVGPLDETMILRGMRYHPVDIENTVTRCHRAICERLV